MLKIENEEVYGWSEEINGHPEFRATKDGRIIGKRGKPLVGHIDRCGYKEVLLSENGKTKNYLAHRLILSTFIPVVGMEKYDVNHKNGNKLDNRLENLEWCTRSENVKHAYDTGLEQKRCGEEHHAHKLTKEMVKYIRKVYIKRDHKYGAAGLADMFGVDRTTIHDIVNQKTWRGIE